MVSGNNQQESYLDSKDHEIKTRQRGPFHCSIGKLITLAKSDTNMSFRVRVFWSIGLPEIRTPELSARLGSTSRRRWCRAAERSNDASQGEDEAQISPHSQ